MLPDSSGRVANSTRVYSVYWISGILDEIQFASVEAVHQEPSVKIILLQSLVLTKDYHHPIVIGSGALFPNLIA